MSDRGEHLADGGFAALDVHHPNPERIDAINREWELDEFLAWGATLPVGEHDERGRLIYRFPYGAFHYWINEYRKTK